MIEEALRYYGISREELAKMLRMSVRTLYRRMASPWTWTVGEINQLKEVFKWTKEECAGFAESCLRSA